MVVVGGGVGWLRPMQMACPPCLPPSPFSSGHAAASGMVGTPFPASKGRRRGWPKSTLPLFMPRTHLVGGLALFSCPFRAPNNGLPRPPPTPSSGLPGGRKTRAWQRRLGADELARDLLHFSQAPEPHESLGLAQRREGAGAWGQAAGRWDGQLKASGRAVGPVGIHHPLQGLDSSCASCFPCASHRPGLSRLI